MKNTIKIKLKTGCKELIIGNNYAVIHNTEAKKPSKATRRIFKGVENGILNIPFLVFTTKVNKEATATVTEEEKTVTTRYHNLKHQSIPNEIIIPFYDILNINP